jgi:alkylation response protein AidB-like acyl-CoA dehydrogenase
VELAFMNTDFTPHQQALREELREFLAEQLPPRWVGVWQDARSVEQSEAITVAMSERGWLTYYWPAEYGGADGTVWDQVVIQEELFAHHEPRGSQYMGVNWIGPALMTYGTDEQKKKYLPEIASGQGFWAQLFSEPDAGSDLAAIRTTAVLDGNEFVINGEKVWTSYANTARHGFLLARSEPGSTRHKGISALLIEMDSPGIEVREIESTIGWHRFHGVTFSDVRVPRSALLGGLHEGWAVAMHALPLERVGNARYARSTRVLGLAESARRAASDADEPEVADILALGRMAELLNYQAAAIKEANGTLDWQASMAFVANATYEQRVAAFAERVYGFEAFVASGDDLAPAGGEIESFVARQAPTVTIQAGTYQVQLSTIARRALGLPRAL